MGRVLPIVVVVACGCEVAMDPDALRPGLTQAIADPALLAPLCRADVAALGPVSASRLGLTGISAKRPLIGGEGSGSVEVDYRPLAPELEGTICRGRVTFDFRDDASARHFTFDNLRAEPR
jgi:hypothetical protein